MYILCCTEPQILGYVKAVQDVTANDVDLETFTREDVEASLVRCPQQDASDAMVSCHQFSSHIPY
jgi:3-dehydroquinate dehydratase